MGDFLIRFFDWFTSRHPVAVALMVLVYIVVTANLVEIIL